MAPRKEQGVAESAKNEVTPQYNHARKVESDRKQIAKEKEDPNYILKEYYTLNGKKLLQVVVTKRGKNTIYIGSTKKPEVKQLAEQLQKEKKLEVSVF